jgi:hypothetical protein
MTTEETKAAAPTVVVNVSQPRKGVNHILHLILTILTGGLWLFVWAGLIINDSRKGA